MVSRCTPASSTRSSPGRSFMASVHRQAPHGGKPAADTIEKKCGGHSPLTREAVMKSCRWLRVVALFPMLPLLPLLLMASPSFAGPREDALGAYMKFFDTFTTANQDAIVRLFAPQV